MKKVMFVTLIALMSCMLVLSVSATDFELEWSNIVHVSYDEIRKADDTANLVCGTDTALINTPTLPSGETGCIFWGWASADNSDIASYSYSIDDGEKVTDPSYRFTTEDAVKAAGPGEYDWRFKVPVPLKEGTQLVKIYADFEDGDSEVIWMAEITVGDGSTGGSTGTGDTTEDPQPPKTGDGNVIVAVAAAGIIMTVLFKKKVSA
ncbi:MAG: hypothetical protein KIC77_10920 [Clostridiales bacterium]|jgi:lipoprotein|nr:hypothetical protein [Clostridiales bacterium]